MSGKPYSIQEFKTIVDYLVENKLYGETKARKMWVDFANTKLTTRTWQSLKETFLKRVLPDIHNPYFHLTNEQISSFRARCDLADRNKNKLEFHATGEDASSNGPKDNEPSHNEGETTAGENIKCSKVAVRSRSSADTVILENCYETAEEIQKDLESNESDEKPTGGSKSLRDCITYSEPLTPMLQEVLDDFASEPEDSDREGQMEIDENVPEDTQEVPEPNNEVLISKSEDTDVAKNAEGLSPKVVEEVLAHELDGGSKPENTSPKENIPNVICNIEDVPVANMDDEISSIQVENGSEKDDDADDDDAEAPADAEAPEATNIVTTEITEKPVALNSETLDVIVVHDSHSEPQVQSSGLNNSNSTVDASLPNNPEALTIKNPKTNNKEASESVIEVTNNSNKTPKSPKKAPRKRSLSEDNSSTIDNKKKKLNTKLKPPAKKDNKVTESHSDTNAEDKLKANEESLQPDVINKPLLDDNLIELDKPSTSFETHVVDIIETEKRSNTKDLPEIKNPCLQNISLFDEQFNKTNYTLSESSDTELNKKESQADKRGASVSKPSNEIVVLRSNSESDTEEVHAAPKKKQRAGVLISKAEREKAIANMFGFTSGGGVGAKRKRQLSRRSRTVSHNNTSHNNVSHHTAAPAPVSNTSDWTSESEDFVSPPRSRKNRPTRKYLKPHALKISALEEEGGLFVMYGKKIYPIIKDGKIVKNYITYLPESDSEEGETFWKQKYEEEKKKASEFKKLLEEAKEPQQLKDTYSPVRQANPHRNSRRSSIAVEPTNNVAKETSLPVPDEKKEELKEVPPETIKIKFTKNNEEVHLEGHWPQIHPVLEQVVHIFHKEIKMAVVPESNTTVMPSAQSKELSSGSSTPVIIPDPEVHAKVNEIEKEIFKEIEELDKEEEIEPNGQATNVTKRKMEPPPPRPSSSPAQSPEKQPKTSNGPETKESERNSRTRKQKVKETENNNNTQEYVSKRPTRMPRKILNETVNINQSQTMKTRRSTQKLNTSVNDEDGEVRYMLPPRNSRHSFKSPINKKTNQKKSSEKPTKIFSSPDSVSLNSMDSTQGYQDTDVSPVNAETKKKKKIDTSSFVIKTRNSIRRSTRRKTHPYLHQDAYNDSSNSSVDASARVVTRENSSLNTDAYRSEFYQLLNARAKVSSRQLESINESTPINNETYFVRHLESLSRNEISDQINHNFTSPSCQMTSDVGSSSNVSLPMSPELSVVENMSISKEVLNSVENYPTINEMQNNKIEEGIITMRSNYNMISDVDCSVPLMNQECEFESCNTVTEKSTEPKNLVTESLLNNIDTFNINDQVTATDTLNKKLRDLLLESAKKTTEISALKEASMMDVDVTGAEIQKKPKANKKRCSTPQKRKGSKKSVAPTVDPVVEEEHMESCLRARLHPTASSGRKSCPPLFQTNLCNDNVVTEEINMVNLTIANEKPKGKKKKDIIRVKIQRPKNKKAAEKIRTESAQNASRISVFTDSGINDSASEVFLVANDSVDLIHNHSETCLHANECVGDSIEFLENSLKSVITLGDSVESGDNAWNSRCGTNEEHSTSPDLFCNNAQDVFLYNRANSEIKNKSDTVYHSPPATEASPNSLITEDLSEDSPPPARPSKWYLFSEDETNTNLVGAGSTMLSSGSYGSNLKQLFSIACAVPNLSTITEMSRENDSSRKPTLEDLDGLTGEDFNSLSTFHSNL